MSDNYPLRILSLGAGVQSTTVLLMMLMGEIERADHVIFADVGWEPDDVYAHLDKLKLLMRKADLPFHQVTAGNIREDASDDGGGLFASLPFFVKNEKGQLGMVRRQCTSQYKIAPLLKKQRELAGLKPRQRSKEHLITTLIGISLDESQRMRDAAFPWIRNQYPLIEKGMTRQDCLNWCANHGFDKPPRSACIGCPFKSQDEWRLLKTRPKEWDDAVQFDAQLRTNKRLLERFQGEVYLHRSGVPLGEVDLRTNDEKGIWSLFDTECEGMCGV
jgi:hypothetical protein